jgi:hypothetical protein
MNAKQIAETIFQNYCVMGVVVTKLNTMEHARSYDYDTYQWVEGTYYKII